MPRPITISHRSAEAVGPGRAWRPGPPPLGNTDASFGEAGPPPLGNTDASFGATGPPPLGNTDASFGATGPPPPLGNTDASFRLRAVGASTFALRVSAGMSAGQVGGAGPRALWPQRNGHAGYSLLELVFAAGIVVTVSGMAAPGLLSGLDDLRAAGAARYISARMQRARMDAVMRSDEVAIQFTQTGSGYTYAAYRDGNHNGVRTRDIQTGVDPPIGFAERLPDHFSAVDFGVEAGLPAVDGGAPPGGDPIRLGASNLASFSSNGTASSGSVYIRGRHAQYVVRLFGATGKVRILKFDRAANQWRPL